MNMKLLRTLGSLKRSILLNKPTIRTITTTKYALAGQTKDYKPGPYPKTEAERIAAAKKYNLSPSEYKPMPDDGLGYGDYPQLPNVSGDMKSDYEDYDYPYLKRDYGEPIHIYGEYMMPEKVSFKNNGPSWSVKISVFLGCATLFFGTAYLLRDKQVFVPMMPKQYPRDVARGAAKPHYEYAGAH